MYFRDRMDVSWKYTFFIARRLQKQQLEGKQAARPIIRIATLSIALAMIVNIITIAVVNGFQEQVRSKVTGFGAHISLLKLGETSLMESAPFLKNEAIVSVLSKMDGIDGIQPVAYKPALLQSVDDKQQREITGAILKGVDNNYDWTFIKKHLKQGRVPHFKGTLSQELILSKRICADLHYKLGDTINAFFVKQQPILRQFIIVGIYETGLEDFDKELVFCHLPQVQQLNDWGIQASISIDDTLSNGQLVVRADVIGGNGNYRFDWGDGFEQYGGFIYCPTNDTTIRLIAADFWTQLNEPTGALVPEGETAVPDTAYLKIQITGNKLSTCQFVRNEDGTLQRSYKDKDGFQFELNAGAKKINCTIISGKGSHLRYIGGYEITIDDWDHLEDMTYLVKKKVLFQPGFQQQIMVKNIQEQHQELFVWLGFLDLNMSIVLILMLLIGIINMGSALLVMILVRTNFIGVMKAMGAPNKLIRRVFLVQAGQLIVRGMIWGNVIGIGFCILQYYFGILSLDPKVYYLTAVPIRIDIMPIIGLNVFTLTVCLSALLIPSFVISRISPAKTIKFR